MKNLITSIKIFVFLTILTGLIYPGFITLIAQTCFPVKANGDKYLIGQKFDQRGYFWSRPEGVSNLSATSKKLQALVAARKTADNMPSDMLYASGSGLDPHISLPAAFFQVERVAAERKISTAEVVALIKRIAEPRDFMIFGQPRVNVLRLNQGLDKLTTPITYAH